MCIKIQLLLLFRSGKLTDQEVIAIEKIFCYLEFPKGNCRSHYPGHMGKHWGQPGCEGREIVARDFTMVSVGRKRVRRQSQRVRFG